MESEEFWEIIDRGHNFDYGADAITMLRISGTGTGGGSRNRARLANSVGLRSEDAIRGEHGRGQLHRNAVYVEHQVDDRLRAAGRHAPG